MGKLHELLAVEGDLEGTFKKILQETKKTFNDKPAFFLAWQRELEMFDDKAPVPPIERQEMVTTVYGKLEYNNAHVVRYFDAIAQKERTNQEAKADLIIGGKAIIKDVPATLLLGLESRLKLLRQTYEAIPTLAPGKRWEKDETLGKDIYVDAAPEEKFKTGKTFKSKVMYSAQFPKEGEGGASIPAQIEKWEEVENVGKYKQRVWSGMLSPAAKSLLLGRVDTLIRGVKKARQRANSTDVVDLRIGETLIDYIMG
jgi:hypothetical protein